MKNSVRKCDETVCCYLRKSISRHQDPNIYKHIITIHAINEPAQARGLRPQCHPTSTTNIKSPASHSHDPPGLSSPHAAFRRVQPLFLLFTLLLVRKVSLKISQHFVCIQSMYHTCFLKRFTDR